MRRRQHFAELARQQLEALKPVTLPGGETVHVLPDEPKAEEARPLRRRKNDIPKATK